MNHLLIAQIEKLPLELQREVEKFVQSLTDNFINKKGPIDTAVVAKRRQLVFEKLDEKVFNAEDF